MVDTRKICVGEFLGAHGVRGLVRLGSFTEDPAALFSYAPLTDESGNRTFSLSLKSTAKDAYLVVVDGITDREAAQALKGTKLYVDRALLPETQEDEYYFADLIGMATRTSEGEGVGHVIAHHDYGAGAMLEIKPAKGSSFMLPFKDAFIPRIDLEKREITVFIPDGWLAQEKDADE
ncbi:MAG: 16S rRNA processing protein RimM [Proteobacteria bacterium]|nr:ribosome maturation factor RimM [Alphaproteobacteria bacterium]NCC03507.1 16S rRNA processing protein RimM [Pseudomonadota bacterium]